jgi:hypothetical protein
VAWFQEKLQKPVWNIRIDKELRAKFFSGIGDGETASERKIGNAGGLAQEPIPRKRPLFRGEIEPRNTDPR